MKKRSNRKVFSREGKLVGNVAKSDHATLQTSKSLKLTGAERCARFKLDLLFWLPVTAYAF